MMSLINLNLNNKKNIHKLKSVNIITDGNGHIIKDRFCEAIVERRLNRERRINTLPRREEIRWEPERNQRRQVVDRRKENLVWRMGENK